VFTAGDGASGHSAEMAGPNPKRTDGTGTAPLCRGITSLIYGLGAHIERKLDGAGTRVADDSEFADRVIRRNNSMQPQ
jgi:hypothetical protein